MAQTDPTYLAYLLRLWREEPGASWRGSLQDPHSSEEQLFSSARELFEHLQRQLEPGQPVEIKPPADAQPRA